VYFGTRSGGIYRAWTGGNDDGLPFLGRVMLAPDGITDMAGTKSVGTMQAVFKTRATLSYSMGLARDYDGVFGAPPSSSSSVASEEDASAWDVADWDVSEWGSDLTNYRIKAGWRGVNSVGFAFSPWVQIASNSSSWLNAKLQRVDVTFTVGGVQL
jgi:hypothetical protein